MKLSYNCANVRGLGPKVHLVPGLNEVPDHVWDRFKSAPDIRRLVESGEIVIVEEPKTAKRNGGNGSNKPKAKPGAEPEITADDLAAIAAESAQ